MNFKKFFLLVFSLILLLLVGTTSQNAEAQEPTPEPPPDHPHPLIGLADLPYLPSSSSVEPLAQPASSNTINDIYTRFAFESFRDQDWEIYTALGDSSNQTRLTISPGVDMQPRLNRGSTQIVFASKRTGNYEIFRMNINGSGLTQLTYSPADDVYPIWSPDGSKIAFQSYRDGQAEIYTMDQNGGSLTRLTDLSSYDGEPYWSPDGSKIAFTSNRSGGYRIWVMNNDGSRPSQMSSQISSQNPVWSSGGNWIAYTADSDGDGWLEIWLMNSDGTGQQLLYRPPNQRDAISTGWSPAGGTDQEELLFTEIEWTYYQNQWYWIYSFIRSVFYDGNNFYPSTYGNIFGTTEINADWQSADIWPPETSVNPLPKYSRAAGFTVSWAGTDLGSYISMWFPQYRTDESGAWVDWGPGVELTQRTYSGTPGSRVYFRVRGEDAASNYEDWPSAWNGDTDTTLYSKQLAGLVVDQRGNQIPNVEVNTSPSALNNDLGGLNGQFVRFMAVPTTTLTISKTNYSIVPPTLLDLSSDRDEWWSLSPQDDVLINGGFETGQLLGWQMNPAGDIFQDPILKHSGKYAALLGRRYLAEIQKLWTTPPSLLFSGSQVIRDPAGNIYMVWSDGASIPGDLSPGVNDIFFSECPSGGSWTTPTIATPVHPGYSAGPKLALEENGTLHMIWYEQLYPNSLVMHATKPLQGAWSEAETVYTSAANLNEYSLAIDSQGGVHISWIQDKDGTYYIHKQPGGIWSVPQKINGSFDTKSLTVDSEDNVHLAWWGGDGIYYYVYLSSRTLTGSWSLPTIIATLNRTAGMGYEMNLLADSSGSLYVLWRVGYSVNLIEKKPGESWSLPVQIISSNDVIRTYDAYVNRASQLHVFWNVYGYTTSNYMIRFPNGVWSRPFSFLTQDILTYSSSLYSAGENQVDISWLAMAYQFPGSVNHISISYQTAQTPRLTQTISIPSTMVRPTLSLAYRVQADPGGGAFQIAINNSVVFTQTASTTAWQHYWADLSALAGTSPQLTFSVTNSSPSLLFEVQLDDISIGSWQTPVVLDVNPTSLRDWDDAHIKITGTNFIPTPIVKLGDTILPDVTWIDEDHLSAAVPTNFQCGKYDIWVINPGGYEAVLEQGLWLVCRRFLPTVTK